MDSRSSIKKTLVSLYSEQGPFYLTRRMNGISNFYRGFLPTIYGMVNLISSLNIHLTIHIWL